MNLKAAALFLACHREGVESPDSRIRKAAELAKKDPDLNQLLERQSGFDAKIFSQLAAVQPPERLEQIANAAEQHPLSLRNCLKNPVFLSGAVGCLLLIGVIVFFTLQNLSRFPGKDAVEEILSSADSMSGAELEPVHTEAGKLGDWFFLKYQSERYGVPSEFASWKAVGCRMFKLGGHPIAQIAVEDNLIFFVFRAADFGVQLPAQAHPWHIFEQEGWAAAVRQDGENCFMMAFVGSRKEMEQLLEKERRP